MSSGLLYETILRRDGTSRAQRQMPQLNPAFIPIEERSLTDWILFAQQYAAELKFFNEKNIDDGNWEAFLSEIKIPELLAYVDNPDTFSGDAERIRIKSRPHLVLFVTFLQLLGYIKDQLNEFTKKHLDFYYYDILGLRKKEPVPDIANILVQLSDDVKEYFVRKGTQLSAGQDSFGKDLIYITDRDTVINAAQIQKIKTFYTGKKTITLQQIGEDTTMHSDERLVKMMQLSLGNPLPGYDNTSPKNEDDFSLVIKAIKEKATSNTSYLPEKLLLSKEEFLIVTEEDKTPENRADTGQILANAYKRKTLQKIREADSQSGFLNMFKYALGDPDDGNALPAPWNDKKDTDVIEEINKDSDNTDYVKNKLHLSEENFKEILSIRNKQDSTDEDWLNVYTYIVEAEKKQKKNSHLADPLQEEWTPGYATADARASAFLAGNSGDATLYFNTFGKGHSAIERAGSQIAAVGFAVSSSQLWLKEGARTIVLTLIFENTLSVSIETEPFSVYLSMEKGWQQMTSASVESITTEYGNIDINKTENTDFKKNEGTGEVDHPKLYADINAVKITIGLSETAPAVVAPAAPNDIMTIQSDYPVLGVIINQNDTTETVKSNYQQFKDAQLHQLKVAVTVEKVKTLTLQNDDAVLNYKKPFEPFGFQPETGSHFYFANPEICGKTLDSLTLNFEWMPLPDFGNQYKNYSLYSDDKTELNSSAFTSALELVEDNVTVGIDSKIAMFSSPDKENGINIPTRLAAHNFVYKRDDLLTTGEEVITWQRYFSLVLNSPDFQHNKYPELVTKQAYDNAQKITTGIVNQKVPADLTPPLKPPYTPKLKSFTVDYTASFVIDFTTEKIANSEDGFFHINAFGYSWQEIKLKDGSKTNVEPVSLLPYFEQEGELYIGITSLSTPQNLSLFFQLAEGSANPDLDKPEVEWSYLSNNGWYRLSGGSIVSDSTGGLLNTGIIELSIPADATCDNTLLGENLYWLRAAVGFNSDAIPDTVSILTQGISTTFIDNGNAPEHYQIFLPPGSIKETVSNAPEIKKISQPYSSSKGKPAEDDRSFYTRVSERLRHKGRALTMWDYEHVILEQFPDIYKVKCVPSAVPGSADIIVIPDIKGKLPFNPFQPKASADMIAAIQAYINQRISPWAEIKIKNPSYTQVKVRIAVKIKKGLPAGFFADQLKNDLTRYLAPWAYEEGADIALDRRIDADVIVNFVAEREYIEYTSDIHLFTIKGDDEPEEAVANEQELYVQAVGPDEILVSAPQHEVDIITEGYIETNYKGIGYMKIGLDFVVA